MVAEARFYSPGDRDLALRVRLDRKLGDVPVYRATGDGLSTSSVFRLLAELRAAGLDPVSLVGPTVTFRDGTTMRVAWRDRPRPLTADRQLEHRDAPEPMIGPR